MPGNPTEAREHAAHCMQLAETSSSPTIQKTFFDLAQQWKKLASDLEDAQRLLVALNRLDANRRDDIVVSGRASREDLEREPTSVA
jgi:hypothetical protein